MHEESSVLGSSLISTFFSLSREEFLKDYINPLHYEQAVAEPQSLALRLLAGMFLRVPPATDDCVPSAPLPQLTAERHQRESPVIPRRRQHAPLVTAANVPHCRRRRLGD